MNIGSENRTGTIGILPHSFEKKQLKFQVSRSLFSNIFCGFRLLGVTLDLAGRMPEPAAPQSHKKSHK